MRELTGHKINPTNDQIKIEVMDAPGIGGASYRYCMSFPAKPWADHNVSDAGFIRAQTLEFQNGPISEVGNNGITEQALIEILIDRLKGFQAGPFACDDNDRALQDLENAQEALLSRTKARMARGVEGTLKV